MTLEEKYNRVRDKYLKKREELEILHNEFEDQTDKITENYNLKREFTESLVKKTKNKKFDDLTTEIGKIEELDKFSGELVKKRKKLRKRIKIVKRDLTEASQILSNMLGDLDYPNDKLKEDFMLSIALYPHLSEIDRKMELSIVMGKKRFSKSIQMNLASNEPLNVSEALELLLEKDPALNECVKIALRKLKKSESDLEKVSIEKESYYKMFKGVYLTFKDGSEYVVTDDLSFAYEVLYWIYGDNSDKWLKYIPYGTRKELDKQGADSSEYWDEVSEDYKNKLLKKFEINVTYEEWEKHKEEHGILIFYLFKTKEEKKEKEKLTKKEVQKDIVEKIRNIANNDIILPDRDSEAYITRRFKKQESLTEFVGLIGSLAGVQAKILVFADKIEKAKAENIIKDLDKIRPLNIKKGNSTV